MLAAAPAKGSALASRGSRYSRCGAMPLAGKERRERHQGARLRTDNAAHRPERGERSLENEIMVWTYSRAGKLRTLQPYCSAVRKREFHKPSGFTTEKDSPPRGPRSGSSPSCRLGDDGFFHAPFLIGYPRDFASTGFASAASTAKAEGLWLSGCGSPRCLGSEYG
jgi:hypothetical protein